MQHNRAFTLVELSIVLVILGLLVGGVLTGQSLIRAAEIRSISTQYAGYMTATQTFRDKYFALPGDMTNATAYWGAADGSTGNTAGCLNAGSSTTLTCNGNGNGAVDNVTNSFEYFRFWQQLANAGLIEGSYNGVAQGGVYGTTTANAPVGRLSSSLWFVFNWGQQTGVDLSLFPGQYGNSLMIGGLTAGTDPAAGILKAEELYNLDTKMDDGKPATGKVVVKGTVTTCTDGADNTAINSNYALASTTKLCTTVFRNIF